MENVPFGHFGIGLAWITFWVITSLWYRKSSGKPIFPRRPDDSWFFEKGVSGHSNKNLTTKLGGAQRCLSVAVTDDYLLVRPTFPFNLMFLPEVYDLEHEIEHQAIESVTEKKGLLWRYVRIEFRNAGGGLGSIDLRLKKNHEFLEVMESVRAACQTAKKTKLLGA